ncbi:MAG: hypothetical protein AAF655_04685 [Bacteroidota bacterium]
MKKVAVEQIQTYTGHKGAVFALCADEAGDHFYSAGDDGVVVRWPLDATQQSGEGMLKIERAIYALAVIHEKNQLWVGASDGKIYVVHTLSRELLITLSSHTKAIYNLSYDAETQQMWALGGKGWLSLIEVNTFTISHTQQLHTENLRSLAFHMDQVFIGGSDHCIYQLPKEKPGLATHKWKAHSRSVFSLLIHPEAHYLLSGGMDAQLAVWDLKQEYRLIRKIPAHYFTVNDLALSPSNDYFMTASRDKTLKLWDAYQFELLKVIDFPRNKGHKFSVNKILWLKVDNSVISGSDDKRIIRWIINTSV